MANQTTTDDPALRIVDPPRSAFRRRRFLVPFWTAALIALSGTVSLVVSGTITLPFNRTVVLEGKLASKSEFFADEQVRRILMRHGIQVHLTKAGSRDIANNDVSAYDFVFPSGQPAAKIIRDQRQRDRQYFKVYKPFFSPLVLATFRNYAEGLATRKAASKQDSADGRQDYYYNLVMPEFVRLMDAGTSWRELGPANGNRVLAQSSDVCWSNSAGVYLGLIAFVANNNQVPVTEAEALRLADRIKPWLTSQGLANEEVARLYFAPEGRGLAPVAVIYEHQFLAHQLRVKEQTGQPDHQRVLLYPEAQLQTVPELIALTAGGARLGELITTHPELRARALALGLRVLEPDGTLATGQLSELLQRNGLPVPQTGIGDTETFLPSVPLLEKMITRVGECPEVPR
ncbi:hypothetical protein N8J89_23420 [Crossiella sp. CA-258035]|uniref:hypothetical protein n=1 Tax=Crossiella sp. CA-258035 TaxID=2981138 RepID=UPI0024BCC599|nr:hypothetical protein [Crossiella sp. CA-258035]WHT16082.1 hypothetical protein N8J89_23420 [Crossiella sp. CA-258035]